MAESRVQANARLTKEIRMRHRERDGVFGAPRMTETLQFEGESVSRNRVARLLAASGIQGTPRLLRWRGKPSGDRPANAGNYLERNLVALQLITKWMTDITYIHRERLTVSVGRPNLYNKAVIHWSMSGHQTPVLVLKAVLVALWQRDTHSERVVSGSDRGTTFTSDECQRFLRGHNLI